MNNSGTRHWAVVTLFPEMFKALTESGISGRAFNKALCTLSCVNPRDYARDKHKTVDDKPYGGGPGMVMAYPPLADSITAAKACVSRETGQLAKVIYLSPQGEKLGQRKVNALASEQQLVLLCGRYEGVDERVIDSFVDEELSIGDYVVSGGELPAMTLLDAMIRMLPGALGDSESAQQDSYAGSGLLDYPHYTRPEVIDGAQNSGPVPEILLSGNHSAIAKWRIIQALQRTRDRRPELLEALLQADRLSAEEKELLEQLELSEG